MKNLFTLCLLVLSLNISAQNNALDFDGVDDYVAIPVTISTTGTFSFWIKLDQTLTTNARILSQDWDNDEIIMNASDGKLTTIGSFVVGDDLISSSAIPINEWTHVAITADGSGSKLYINGKLDDTGGAGAFSLTNIEFGGQYTALWEVVPGQLDELRIWNDVRTEAEIRANMYKELIGNEAGLLAYFKFNETNGTTADNTEGTSAYDGTLNNMGGTEWTTSSAFFGTKKCYYFNGTNSYVSLGSNLYNDNFSNGTSITIEYWYRGYNLQSAVRFQDMSGNYVVAGWGGTNPQFIISSDGGSASGVLIGSDADLEDDNWHHIACTWEKNTTNGFKTYVDGVLANQKNSGNVNLPAINYNGLLGAYHGPAEVLQGELDEVRIWSDVRTAAEIRENMNKSLVGDEIGLVAYYNFDSGNTLANIVSTNYDGSAANIVCQTSTPPTFNTWLNTDDPDWSTATNWSAGIPISTDHVGIYNYSGGTLPSLSGTPTINNLVIGSSAGIALASNATVTNSLFLFDDVNLNSNQITIGTSGTLFESGGVLTGADGFSENTQDLNNITSENIGGLGAEITTSANLGSTVIQRYQSAITGPTGDEGINRYYVIDPTNNTGLNATLVFHYDDAELNGKNEANLMLFKSDDNGSTWTEVGGTINTTDNTITLSSIGDFSWWTAAESGATLPVELLSFSGELVNETIELNWSTASEVNSEAFVIERSCNAIDFEFIAELSSSGNSNEILNYGFTDKHIETGKTYYYRLSQRDYNGSVEVHKTIAIKTEDLTRDYIISSIYPIPFKDELSIGLNFKGKVSICIYDASGCEMKQVKINSNTNTYKIDLGFLPQGVYYISLESNESKESHKIVKL